MNEYKIIDVLTGEIYGFTKNEQQAHDTALQLNCCDTVGVYVVSKVEEQNELMKGE